MWHISSPSCSGCLAALLFLLPCLLKRFALFVPYRHIQHTGTLHCRVTQLEAERLDATRDEREAFRRMLLEEVERQARKKHVHIKLPDGRQL